MPLPYSIDLCWQIVWLALVLHASADIAKKLNISRCTVSRYVAQFQQTGDVVPRVRRHGAPRLLGDHEQLILLRLILENPGIYLHELKNKLFLRVGVEIHVSTICKTL